MVSRLHPGSADGESRASSSSPLSASRISAVLRAVAVTSLRGNDPGEPCAVRLERSQNLFDRAGVEARTGLDGEPRHRPVLDDGGIALGAGTQTEPAAVHGQSIAAVNSPLPSASMSTDRPTF